MEPAPIRYTKVRDGWVAYMVVGEGPRDIVYMPGFLCSLDVFWESPPISRFFTHIASHGRLIMFDRRGAGLSDRLPADASIVDEWCHDAIGVMDEVGSQRATLLGGDTACAICLKTAAMHPDRVEALILMEAFASAPQLKFPPEAVEQIAATFESTWGEGKVLRSLNPEMPDWADQGFAGTMLGKLERSSLPKGEVRHQMNQISRIDVSDILGDIEQPTIMFSSLRDQLYRYVDAQRLAEAIGAQLIPIDSADMHGWMSHMDMVIPEIGRFLGGTDAETDRFLATVLFSDIVGSTEHAVAAGDGHWKAQLEAHDRIVDGCVNREHGTVVKHTGDGILATFDSPARAIRATQQIRDSLRSASIEVYQGLHTGEIVRRGSDISGLAVHIAARVGALAQSGEILVTRTVRDLVVGSALSFTDRGTHELKGVPDTWQLFSVNV